MRVKKKKKKDPENKTQRGKYWPLVSQFLILESTHLHKVLTLYSIQTIMPNPTYFIKPVNLCFIFVQHQERLKMATSLQCVKQRWLCRTQLKIKPNQLNCTAGTASLFHFLQFRKPMQKHQNPPQTPLISDSCLIQNALNQS